MSDRRGLFLFSLLMIAGGIASAAWIAATGQAATVDGLFLLLAALLVVLSFGLYLVFLVRGAMEASAKPSSQQAAKAGAAPSAAKRAATPVAQA